VQNASWIALNILVEVRATVDDARIPFEALYLQDILVEVRATVDDARIPFEALYLQDRSS
jgi:hypothetical protein